MRRNYEYEDYREDVTMLFGEFIPSDKEIDELLYAGCDDAMVRESKRTLQKFDRQFAEDFDGFVPVAMNEQAFEMLENLANEIDMYY